MHASLKGFLNPYGRNESNWARSDLNSTLFRENLDSQRIADPFQPLIEGETAYERGHWDPKDGELCLSRMKPEETLVEVRSDSDVQIDRQTRV